MSIGKDNHVVGAFNYDNLTLKNSNEKETIGATIDRKFILHQYTKKMCLKAGQH